MIEAVETKVGFPVPVASLLQCRRDRQLSGVGLGYGTLWYPSLRYRRSYQKNGNETSDDIVETEFSTVRDYAPNTSISYGRTFFTVRDGRIAVLPIGHADDLFRSLSNKMQMLAPYG